MHSFGNLHQAEFFRVWRECLDKKCSPTRADSCIWMCDFVSDANPRTLLVYAAVKDGLAHPKTFLKECRQPPSVNSPLESGTNALCVLP